MTPLSQKAADALGAEGVAEEEVKEAPKHSAPGKAAGRREACFLKVSTDDQDGLPVDVYRKCASLLASLLAKVYTAMGQLRDVPTEFLDWFV